MSRHEKQVPTKQPGLKSVTFSSGNTTNGDERMQSDRSSGNQQKEFDPERDSFRALKPKLENWAYSDIGQDLNKATRSPRTNEERDDEKARRAEENRKSSKESSDKWKNENPEEFANAKKEKERDRK